MTAIVVDASVAFKWVVEEEDSAAALALRQYGLLAPDFILMECANVLWLKARRGELSAHDVHDGMRILERAPMTLVPASQLLARATEIALAIDHPIYDCIYLALASQRSIPVVTADKRFAAAARRPANPPGRVVLLGEPIDSQGPAKPQPVPRTIAKVESALLAQDLPFTLNIELPGWTLFCAHLTLERDVEGEIAALRAEVAERARHRFADNKALAAHPTVAALRRLFKAAGCDPTRYRPSSEALLRRLVRGDEMPAIHPLVDLNNCLSAELAVPCCVMAEGSFGDKLALRAGQTGESYVSLRGPFKLDGKPLLVDEDGPLDTPITGSERVKVAGSTRRAWLVAYLPSAELSSADTGVKLAEFAPRCGVAHVAHGLP